MFAATPESLTPPDLSIPPRPRAVMVLLEETGRDDPDVKRITQAIQSDPGMAGAMLKVVNSAAFGLTRKATSIAQVVGLLGLSNLKTITNGLAIRLAMSGQNNVAMERFWDTAENVALICAELARNLRGISPDEAYMLGLFHDCGIPLLMRRYPNYRETLVRANGDADRAFSVVEEADVGTHHGAVGYFVARSWQLPTFLCQAILWHHEVAVFSGEFDAPAVVQNYVALIHFAEHIHHARMRSGVDIEWTRFGPAVLRHFSLDEEDYLNLVDAMQDNLAQA